MSLIWGHTIDLIPKSADLPYFLISVCVKYPSINLRVLN